mmetsp:Transcript_21737/g.43207  ORF Transcript_21737/g.43207 Transcript_21737/m.43207 type:complete len:307 (+) Transcript_21737:492-1412(+)
MITRNKKMKHPKNPLSHTEREKEPDCRPMQHGTHKRKKHACLHVHTHTPTHARTQRETESHGSANAPQLLGDAVSSRVAPPVDLLQCRDPSDQLISGTSLRRRRVEHLPQHPHGVCRLPEAQSLEGPVDPNLSLLPPREQRNRLVAEQLKCHQTQREDAGPFDVQTGPLTLSAPSRHWTVLFPLSFLFLFLFLCLHLLRRQIDSASALPDLLEKDEGALHGISSRLSVSAPSCCSRFSGGGLLSICLSLLISLTCCPSSEFFHEDTTRVLQSVFRQATCTPLSLVLSAFRRESERVNAGRRDGAGS